MKNHQSMEEIVKNEVESSPATPPALASVADKAQHTAMTKKQQPNYTTEELGVMISPSAEPPEKPVSNVREALPQVLATSAKNLLLLAYGMTLGFPTIIIPALENGLEENLQLTAAQISWVSSINLICVPIGCLGSGVLTNYLGRKRAMMIVNVPLISAWVMLHFAQSPGMLYSALALTGLTGGLLEAPVLTYVAEITTPLMRGVLSSTSSMCVILGINSQFIMGNFLDSWRTVALINTAAPIIAFCGLLLVPESPYWLASKKKVEEARRSLAWLRGWLPVSQVEHEFNELLETVNAPQHSSDEQSEVAGNAAVSRGDQIKQSLKPYLRATFIKPFLLVSGAFFFGHFCGMTTLQTYAVSIFEELGAPIDPFLATMILGLVELTGTLLCVCAVHWSGKRPLTLISTVGTAVCFGVVAAYDMMRHAEMYPMDAASWVPLTFLLSSAFLTHMGIRLLPWILIGEVFPSEVRGIAAGAASSVGYIFGFLANKTHFSLVGALTLAGTFWVYVGVSLVATLVFYMALPETEGRTLLEINMHFAGQRQKGWKRRLPRPVPEDLKAEDGKSNGKIINNNASTVTHRNGTSGHVGINGDPATWAADNPSLSVDTSHL